jgi:O-antigen ligase
VKRVIVSLQLFLQKQKYMSLLVVLCVGILVAIMIEVLPPLALGLLLLICIFLFIFLKYPRWLVYALAACIPFQVEVLIGQLSGARFSSQTLGAMLLIIIFLINGLLNGNYPQKIFKTPYLRMIIFFLILSSLAIATGPLVTGYVQGIWAIYRNVWVAPLIFFAVWVFLRNTKFIRRSLVLLAACSSFGAFTALVQIFTSGKLLSGIGTNYRYLGFLVPLPPEVITTISGKFIATLYLGRTHIYRGYGTFLTSNGLGVLLCVSIFITWGLYASGTSKKRWIWILLLGIQIFGLVSTFSRSAWVAALTGMGVILLPVLKKWISHLIRIPKALIASLVIAIIAIPFIFSNENIRTRLLTAFTPTEVGEFAWRVIIWNYASKEILQHPFLGVGTSTIDNTIAQILDPNSIETFSTHNLYFDIAYQRGLINLAFFILFSLFFFRSALKIYLDFKKNNLSDQKLVLGLIAGVVAFLVSGIGSASMANENLATLFWLLFGIVVTWERY